MGEDGLLCTMLELKVIVANAELPVERRHPQYAYILEDWEWLAENRIHGRINRAARTVFQKGSNSIWVETYSLEPESSWLVCDLSFALMGHLQLLANISRQHRIHGRESYR